MSMVTLALTYVFSLRNDTTQQTRNTTSSQDVLKIGSLPYTAASWVYHELRYGERHWTWVPALTQVPIPGRACRLAVLTVTGPEAHVTGGYTSDICRLLFVM